MSGDIRRGLELCIRAVEIAEAEYKCAPENSAALKRCLHQGRTRLGL